MTRQPGSELGNLPCELCQRGQRRAESPSDLLLAGEAAVRRRIGEADKETVAPARAKKKKGVLVSVQARKR